MKSELKVTLIRHTPDVEKLIASAAKLCYSQVGIDSIEEGLTVESTDKFLDRLMSMGHESPIEHAVFTFGVEGVSRVLTHQLVRHRIASYSQQSQRYVKLEQFEYVIPPAIEEDEEAKALFVKAMEEDQKYYNQITKKLFEKNYKKYIAKGYSEKKAKMMAEKTSIEDARYVFPNACETKIVFTMNARTLFNFFNHRCCNRAQWEIRQLATEMLRQVKAVAPTLFKYCGPSCINDPCPEGNMTCGHIQEVREKFKNL
ncbi:FAD-dependent thymidylate synthase [Abyssisolibacter fermentans]|uniref:FAD-dependent thymidylate synthase n=1 Tax=Abyssisolibacter fermentans TaxID=1766203 RepID=UPI0008364282|nr:FAD-dependent thymidylate synthase [Abyssisolibacter fermentans]